MAPDNHEAGSNFQLTLFDVNNAPVESVAPAEVLPATTLTVETASESEPSAKYTKEGDPILSEEDEKELDHLMDHGFNRETALRRIGFTGMRSSVETNPVESPRPKTRKPKPSRRGYVTRSAPEYKDSRIPFGER